MEVPVAGMPPGAGAQAVAGADLKRRLDPLLEAIERHDDVLADLAAERRLDRQRDSVAPAPQRLDRGALLRRENRVGAVGERFFDLGRKARRLTRGPVGFGDDHQRALGRALAREAVRGEGDRRRIEILERSDRQAGFDHARERLRARGDRRVKADHGERRLGRWGESQPGGRDHGKGALGADEQRAQVIARDVLADRPADFDHLAACEDRLEAGHPGAGRAVLEGVRSAGVGRDVAADLRLLGRARVGREEQPVLTRQTADVGGCQARLDADPP